jgi:hypothetical protein
MFEVIIMDSWPSTSCEYDLRLSLNSVSVRFKRLSTADGSKNGLYTVYIFVLNGLEAYLNF